ncbi:MAG TPA: putative Ig domain-containing protein, partial [Vicinamibacterales bacterium]|nr:putative Ig domain-containing protein [Vicinamibacterales bacterium]
PGTGGSYAITITAMNGVGSVASQSFTLSVQQPPAVTSAASTSFVAGSPGTFTITTTGTPAPAITQGGALPSGVNYVDNGDGTATLSGTPGAATGGTYNLTFTAANGVGAPAVQNFTLTVQQAPAVTSADNATFTVGVAGTFTVTTTGFPTPGIARVGALPAGVTFVDNLNGTGTLAGTPGAGTQGAYSLTFTASNGVGSPAAQDFTFTVACPAIALAPAAGALTGGTYQQAYSQTFLATGGTGHTFALSAGAVPAGLTLAANGTLSGTPTNTGAFSFTVQATDASGCTGSAAYSLSVVPNAVDETYTGGVGNTQYVVAPSPTSATPAVLVSGSVLNNDAGPGPLTTTAGTIATVNGGSVSMASNGAFVYTPAIAFAGPADAFTYTLTDGNGITDMATVTITLSSVVWYVNSAGGNGDGRSHNPFNTVTAAQAPSVAGHYIFVHLGSGTTPGTITLKANQTLWGAGTGFFVNSLSIPGVGANPLLLGTITLASGVVVNSLNVDGQGGAAFNGTGITGSQAINGVNVVGGTSGVNLVNFGGSLAFTTTSISGIAGPSIIVNGGAGSMSGRVNITSTAGRSLDVQNKTGGTFTLTGTINDSSLGVLLDNNTGATVNFTGVLTLNTGSNAAFTATGGGTLNLIANGSTITTTTGTALTISNTTIGSSGVRFQSVSANGATNGIVLNSTGSFAGLTVTGDGGGSNNGSGGVIQNTTGPAISLTNTANVSLGYMNIVNSGDDGIYGLGVTNFTLNRSNLTNNGNSTADEGIQFGNPTGTAAGLSGVASITSTNISGSAHNNVWIRNGAGTLTSFTVTNSTFNDLNDVTGANSFLFETTNTATVTAASITGSIFSNNSPQRALDVIAHGDTGTGFSATIAAFTVSGNTFTDNGLHVDFAVDTAASLGFSLLNNTMTGAAPGHAVNVFSSSQTTGGTLTGRIQNNTIGNAGVAGSGSTTGNGIRVLVQGLTAATLLLDNNVIRQTPLARGIDIQFLGPTSGASAPASDVTVTNNDVNPQDATGFPAAAIYIAADSQGGGTVTVRTDVHGNTVPSGTAFDALSSFLIVDEVVPAAVAQLVDTAPANASCAAQLASANTGSADAAAGCALIAGPLNTPPLLAAGLPSASTPVAMLTQAALDAFVTRAAARLGGGRDAATLVRAITVRDLAAQRLGEAHLGGIAIDGAAAGFGWFVDPTPDTNEEFEVSATGGLVARANGPAAGKMDLLTALVHEAHHVFGDADRESGTVGVMTSTLPAGVRRLAN